MRAYMYTFNFNTYSNTIS